MHAIEQSGTGGHPTRASPALPSPIARQLYAQILLKTDVCIKDVGREASGPSELLDERLGQLVETLINVRRSSREMRSSGEVLE